MSALSNTPQRRWSQHIHLRDGILIRYVTLETAQYANEQGETYPVYSIESGDNTQDVDVRLATIVGKFLFVPLNPTRYLLLFSST